MAVFSLWRRRFAPLRFPGDHSLKYGEWLNWRTRSFPSAAVQVMGRLPDLPGDRKEHPHRVLPRAFIARQFRTTLWALSGVCLGLAAALDPSGRKVGVLSQPRLGVLPLVSMAPRSMHARIPRGAVEVSRIPLSIDTGSCSTSGRDDVVYLTACVYEVLHDFPVAKGCGGTAGIRD